MNRTVAECRPTSAVRRREGLWVWAAAVGVVWLTAVATAAEPRASDPSASRPAPSRSARRSDKVDHAVTPAGGGQSRCSHCERPACSQCRLAEGSHAGHRQCEHGLCPAHCPVRPEVFGFYGTQWRKWPGSGVVQASNNEAVTPARPPRAEVPGAGEESLEPEAAAAELPAPPAATPPAALLKTPVLESPVVESPVVESPVVESPVVESPVVESPSFRSLAIADDAMSKMSTMSTTAWRNFTTSDQPLSGRTAERP